MAGKATTDPFEKRTRALVMRFRRQRPLRTGSLLVTILGDAIAPRGGVIALSSLIGLGRLFGLTERLVRTSIARLANEHWVGSQRSGRVSFYSLTSQGRIRFAEATRRIYGGSPETWNGQWTLVFLPASPRKLREQLRQQLFWLGYGQIAPGVLAHPSDGIEEVRSILAQSHPAPGSSPVPDATAVLMCGSGHAVEDDLKLVSMGWDFGDLSRRYRRFIDMFAPLHAALEDAACARREPAGEISFVLRTLLLHEYRKIHLRDPLLPAPLLPRNWVGADAQQLCRKLYARVFPASERYLSATVQTHTGPLPAASSEILQRFGGLPAP